MHAFARAALVLSLFLLLKKWEWPGKEGNSYGTLN